MLASDPHTLKNSYNEKFHLCTSTNHTYAQGGAKLPHTHKIAQRLSSLTGLPPEGFCDMPILLCRSNMELQVEGCRAILAYSDTEIRLDLREMQLIIEGTALQMSDFHGRCLTIRGKIAGQRWEV